MILAYRADVAARLKPLRQIVVHGDQHLDLSSESKGLVFVPTLALEHRGSNPVDDFVVIVVCFHPALPHARTNIVTGYSLSSKSPRTCNVFPSSETCATM